MTASAFVTVLGGRRFASPGIAIQSRAYIRILAGVAIALSSARLVAADPKRDAPDYDGRGNTDTNAGSWALWIPRVALSPLYVVNEYVVRRPLGGLVTVAERRHWVSAVSDFFTFGSDNNYVVVPTVGYSWPVWMWLDGQARFSMGNAFGSHLGGFTGDKLRLSADLGVTSVGKRDQGFEVLFGAGTETLEQGAGITSVRLSFGSRKGF